MYKTQTKVKTSGRTGEKDIVAEVTYVDGAQVSKKIISETVTREPVKKRYTSEQSLFPFPHRRLPEQVLLYARLTAAMCHAASAATADIPAPTLQ